jgi:hypothetical protein
MAASAAAAAIRPIRMVGGSAIPSARQTSPGMARCSALGGQQSELTKQIEEQQQRARTKTQL